ncbi:uncharacterized protein LDX57_002636 [Aspergillus melleus]|uniref:uncharacterized protein n=1 Tax=Aspergillus melleus TaxID=138277 RepID=UPI001E8D32DB|nr:uncharacterized protein LDX57_002636 [Aspergillus melleus]KAH8424891.1 hypothetical protein LDX57_002636 [Aspergillus melleus]
MDAREVVELSSKISLSNCEIEAEDDPDESGGEATEIQELCKGIRSVITHLFKLSMIIRQNKPRGREGKTSALEPLDPTADMMHIRDRYEKARKAPWLIDRLGKAITARREYFRYRMWRQEEQCTQQSDLAEDAGPGDAHAATLKATTFDGDDMTVVLKNPLGNYSIEPVRSTEASITSYATSLPGANEETLRVPNPPSKLSDGTKFEYGEPFECPYCRNIRIVQDRSQWKRHVFEDLQPYVCTAETCTSSPFTKRHEWFDHELNQHRKRWHCIICSEFTYTSRNELTTHIQRQHGVVVTAVQIPLIADAGGRTQTYFGEGQCPLCNDWKPILSRHNNNAPAFRRHLGKHLEQLALFALPRLAQDESTEGDDSSESEIIRASTDSLESPVLNVYGSESTSEKGKQLSNEGLVRGASQAPPSASVSPSRREASGMSAREASRKMGYPNLSRTTHRIYSMVGVGLPRSTSPEGQSSERRDHPETRRTVSPNAGPVRGKDSDDLIRRLSSKLPMGAV